MTKKETEDILIQYELLKTSIGLIKALTEESSIDEKIKTFLDETKDGDEDNFEHPYSGVWLSKCNADEHLENLNKRIDQLNELVPNIQDEHGKRMDERYA